MGREIRYKMRNIQIGTKVNIFLHNAIMPGIVIRLVGDNYYHVEFDNIKGNNYLFNDDDLFIQGEEDKKLYLEVRKVSQALSYMADKFLEDNFDLIGKVK